MNGLYCGQGRLCFRCTASPRPTYANYSEPTLGLLLTAAEMATLPWREGSDGTFVAGTTRYHLVVRRPTDGQHWRYQVRDVRRPPAEALIGAGLRLDPGRAMDAAERMAALLSTISDEDHSSEIILPARPPIVLVDDDCYVRGAIADTLRDHGYRVAETDTGEDAVRILDPATLPAVVVADINLGSGMTGFELATEIKLLCPMTGTLLISGDDPPDLTDVPASFLGKPFTAGELLARITDMTAYRRPSLAPCLH
jgi:CheY-like chemotaxis protein